MRVAAPPGAPSRLPPDHYVLRHRAGRAFGQPHRAVGDAASQIDRLAPKDAVLTAGEGIEERIGRLEQELRRALTVGSVEGEDFTAEVVARVQKAEERALVRKTAKLVPERLVARETCGAIATIA